MINMATSWPATLSVPFIYDRVSGGSALTYWHELNAVGWEAPQMSDGSITPLFGLSPPPKKIPFEYWPPTLFFYPFKPWIKEKQPKTRVLSLGEGSGQFILELLLRRRKSLRQRRLSFEQAPYLAVDAAYGFLQGVRLLFPSASTWNNPNVPYHPDFRLMERMRSQFPQHYYYGTFQSLNIRDAADRPLEFDEIVARHSLGQVLRGVWDRDGVQAMRQVLDRILLHSRNGGRIRVSGFIKDNEPPLPMDELFFDDLEILLKMVVAQGVLQSYNTNFRHMPHHLLILVKK